MSRTYTVTISRIHDDTFATTTTSPRIKGQDGAGFTDGTTVSWREWLVVNPEDIRGYDDVAETFSRHVAPNTAEKAAILAALSTPAVAPTGPASTSPGNLHDAG